MHEASELNMGRIVVFGSGNFGSCLADHLSDSPPTSLFSQSQPSNTNSPVKSPSIHLYSRSLEVIQSLNTSHKHPTYLKDHTFHCSLKAVGPEIEEGELGGWLERGEVETMVFAIPTQGLGGVLERVKTGLKGRDFPLSIYVNKGIESSTNHLPIEIIAKCCGRDVAKRAVFLSGPSFAKEIINRQPTQVSVASFDETQAKMAAEVFHQPHFRCYINRDPIGVEIAGAIKNVYAIASGVATGLGYQANTRAGLVTRSLAEMTRIGTAMGADPLTFLSLSGVGDLFLTCSSEQSRNFTVGRRLGGGEKLKEILENLGSVAEGVETAKGLHQILTTLTSTSPGPSSTVSNAFTLFPISTSVYRLLYQADEQNLTAKSIAQELMTLPAMEEHEFPRSRDGNEEVGAGRVEMDLRKKLGI